MSNSLGTLCVGYLFDMEGGDNILDIIHNDYDDGDDVEMVDVEEGELVEPDSRNSLRQSEAGGTNEANEDSHNKDHRLRAKKKRNKRKKKASGSNKAIDINRFVIDVCRHLKEKKQYMVYTAVGCLGVSALSDLVKEVDAIQACGGQKTADGSRFRTGGGILWNIIKVREPKVYKEIMKKVKEFEKQFRQPYVKQPPVPKKIDPPEGINLPIADRDEGNVLGSAFPASQMQDQHKPAATSEVKPIPIIHDRLRTPVSYDDDLLGEDPEKDAT
ncbi:hypothetical protein S83_025196 [Arachis hypogaea]|uniref:Phosphorylated adapter RNA export protein n=1 Tax=Arachis hypogaea TaxID=3818 RepID=A0A445BU98_ARAHY|nr:hypothetical protein Ahy_A08g038761 isoform B [Arachis hypogaea]